MSASEPGHADRQRIVVVCYGNICRSPMAEALLKRALREAKLDRRYVVRSAGVGAQPGAPAARGTLEAARTKGIDLSNHRARKLTADMAREAEVLIALDEVVEEEIAILAGPIEVILWPVDDPYGGPSEGYSRALTEIEVFVDTFVKELRKKSGTNGVQRA